MTYVTTSFDQSPKYPALRFFHQLHLLYAQNAWLLIKILTPAAVFSAFAILLAKDRSTALLAHARTAAFPNGYAIPVGGYVIAAFAVVICGWALSWLVNVFAFAAIAIAMQNVQDGIATTAEECYAPVRRHVGTVVLLAFVLFAFIQLSFFGGTAVIDLLMRMMSEPPRWLVLGSSSLIVLLGFTVTATYGLSVPAAVLEELPFGAALRRSDFLTGHSFGQLLLLIVESLLSGYLAAQFPYWIARVISQGVGWARWANWVVWVFAAYGMAMADLVLLIGLSVLYLELRSAAQTPVMATESGEAGGLG